MKNIWTKTILILKLIQKKISYNIKEAYKYKLKVEKHKDDNTIRFGITLVENGKHNEAVDFIKSKRKEERKQEIIRNIFILLSSFVLLFIYL